MKKTYLATATIMTMIPWILLMIAEIPGNHTIPYVIGAIVVDAVVTVHVAGNLFPTE